MPRLPDYPLLTFFLALIVLWASAKLGAGFAHRIGDIREDLNTIMTATLTLLGLLLGFTFSMAIGRYDQRKNLEEEEANAIGTEYARADLLPAPECDNLRRLLRQYLDQRILFYKVRNRQTLQQINAATAQLQDRLWASAKEPSSANPTAITALIIAGMNDVLNSQSYVQAGWSNQIPRSAWLLLDLIAICSNVMVGLSFRTARSKRFLILILPFVVSISLFLIADIDSPRGGLIHVEPENLRSLAQSLRT